MAKINFGELLSSQKANDVYLLKSEDDTIVSILSLENGGDVNKFVANLQEYLYEISDTTGIVGEGDINRKIYSSTNYISNGDSRKLTIEKLDTQVKINADNIATNAANIAANLATLQGGETLIKSYVDDAAYELENGAPPFVDKTAIYYNTTSGLLRYYDDVKVSWEEVGKTSIGAHETLGYGDGLTVDFSVTSLPLTDESFIVFRNGLAVDSSEYTFATPTITFNSAPYVGQKIAVWMLTEGTPALAPISLGTQIVQYKTLDATDITNKYITIPASPGDVTKVLLDVIKGSSQEYGVDFSVSGTQLTWNGLGLDGQLNIGDILRYHYFA